MSEKSENKGIPERINTEELPQSESVKKEKRTERAIIYLTPTEKKNARKKAKKSKLSVSGYFRFRGLSDFAIDRGRGIERIKQLDIIEDPLMVEMRKGFSQVVNEIKQGFEEQRTFLKPIPEEDQKEILKRKQEIKQLIY